MTPSKNICVYCAASSSIDQKFKDIAQELGVLFGTQNWNLIYGGGHIGLMGILADSALKAGTKVTGIIPQFLHSKEIAHDGLALLQITETLQERQKKMADLADAFLVLPGGFGTLAEFFEILTWKQLDLHQKPIIILNAYDYWSPLIQLLNNTKENEFSPNKNPPYFQVISTLKELPENISWNNL